jgi:hypothetical protein
MLGILDQQHHRLVPRQALEEQPPPGEQLLPRQRTSTISGEHHPEQPPQPHPYVGSLIGIGDKSVQPSGQLGGRGVGRVFLAIPIRCRTISARAQKATPSP